MDILIILLLIVGIVFISISWAKSEVKCPPPKIIYRYIPKNTLDVQFGDDNNPSEIYYLIENELGQKFWYSSNRFKSISDHRDDKLVILFGEQKTLTK